MGLGVTAQPPGLACIEVTQLYAPVGVEEPPV